MERATAGTRHHPAGRHRHRAVRHGVRRLLRRGLGGLGLDSAQTMVLSLVMFTGASQFAFVGVARPAAPRRSGAGEPAARGAQRLLRRADVGDPAPAGLARLWTAHFVIDETTAMAVGQATPRARRYAFWATGMILCSLWQLGSLVGALIGRAVDPRDVGLDAASPAVTWPCCGPHSGAPEARWVALSGAVVALVLMPLTPPGIPVVAAAGVALSAGYARAPRR